MTSGDRQDKNPAMKIFDNKELKIGIFVILVLAATFLVINYLRNKDIFNREYEVSAVYEDVQGLLPSASVMFKGYKVGQVNEVEYDNASGLFTVYLLGKVYDNMQFESISKISNSDNVTGYKLEITMKEILKVTPSMSIITEAQAKIAQDATVQELGQSTAQNMSNNKTVLKTIKDSGFGLSNLIGGLL